MNITPVTCAVRRLISGMLSWIREITSYVPLSVSWNTKRSWGIQRRITSSTPSKQQSTISNYFDGDIIWTTIRGVYSWYDGMFSHEIVMANTPKFWEDFISSLIAAVEANAYRQEVIPQIVDEIGDMSFAEYNWRERNYYV